MTSRYRIAAALAVAVAAAAVPASATELDEFGAASIAGKTCLTTLVAVDVPPGLAFRPATIYFSPTSDVMGVPVGAAVLQGGPNVLAASNPQVAGYYTIECEGRVKTISDDEPGLN